MAVKSNLEQSGEDLNAKDFKLKFVFELVPRRSLDQKTQYKICKFFDYAPRVFNEIRKMYSIKSEDYLRSIGPETMLNNLIKGNLASLSELTSTGKSGSFFYFSADGKRSSGLGRGLVWLGFIFFIEFLIMFVYIYFYLVILLFDFYSINYLF